MVSEKWKEACRFHEMTRWIGSRHSRVCCRLAAKGTEVKPPGRASLSLLLDLGG